MDSVLSQQPMNRQVGAYPCDLNWWPAGHLYQSPASDLSGPGRFASGPMGTLPLNREYSPKRSPRHLETWPLLTVLPQPPKDAALWYADDEGSFMLFGPFRDLSPGARGGPVEPGWSELAGGARLQQQKDAQRSKKANLHSRRTARRVARSQPAESRAGKSGRARVGDRHHPPDPAGVAGQDDDALRQEDRLLDGVGDDDDRPYREVMAPATLSANGRPTLSAERWLRMSTATTLRP